MDAHIYEIYGKDPKTMTLALMEAAKIRERIPAGATIALKPNLVVARPPESGATTHAGILDGVLQYLFDNGFKDVSIIEGSWVGDTTPRAAKVCGYDVLARRYGVSIFDLKQDTYTRTETKAGIMEISARALAVDYLINLPVLKGHCQTIMTCALKNCKGCLSDREKRHFHTMGLHKPIAALAAKLMPKLTIVDSLCGDLNFEEGGNPVQTNRMLLGEDMVKIDAYGCSLLGIDPNEVDYIPLARQFGAGSMAIAESDIIRLNTGESNLYAQAQQGLARKLTQKVSQQSACSACFGNLTHALYRLDSDYGYTPREPIYIGQGYKGVPLAGVGIGNCCDGALKQVKGCPPSAKAIMETLQKLE